MSLPDIATLEEAADYLRSNTRKVRSLALAHKIAHIKDGRAITFRREALETYAAENEIPAVGPNPFGLTNQSARRIQASGHP